MQRGYGNMSIVLGAPDIASSPGDVCMEGRMQSVTHNIDTAHTP